MKHSRRIPMPVQCLLLLSFLASPLPAQVQDPAELNPVEPDSASDNVDAPIELDENGVPPGWIIIEGDILVPEDFEELRSTYNTLRWTNGVVPFRFDANVTGPNQTNMLNAMAEWSAIANISFIPRTNQSNFVHIRDSTGNSSAVGMVGGQQTINIHDWGLKFVICHELGHCLGYWHEQTRLDRDAFVQVVTSNIQQNGCNGNSCNHNFNLRSGSGGEYGPYDFDSVMHYDACSFSICCPTGSTCNCPTGCETIFVLPPNDVAWQANIGQRAHLSTMDMLTMSFMYPFSDWRFVEQGAGGSDAGTFQNPYKTWSRAMSETPTGGTLWIREPDQYSAVGTYSRAMTWRVGYGSATLGN